MLFIQPFPVIQTILGDHKKNSTLCRLHRKPLKAYSHIHLGQSLSLTIARRELRVWRPESVVTRPVLRESKHGSLRDHRPQPAGSGARPSAAAMCGDGVQTAVSVEKGVPAPQLPTWRQFTEDHNRQSEALRQPRSPPKIRRSNYIPSCNQLIMFASCAFRIFSPAVFFEDFCSGISFSLRFYPQSTNFGMKKNNTSLQKPRQGWYFQIC